MSLRRRFTRWLADKARQGPTVTPEQIAHRQDFIERVERERRHRKRGAARADTSQTGGDHELQPPHAKSTGDQ